MLLITLQACVFMYIHTVQEISLLPTHKKTSPKMIMLVSQGIFTLLLVISVVKQPHWKQEFSAQFPAKVIKLLSGTNNSWQLSIY